MLSSSARLSGSARRSGPSRPGRAALAGRALSFWLVSYRRVWRGSLFSNFLAPVMFLTAMGYGLGSLVDAGPAGGVAGMSYLAFLAPGLLAAQAMQTGVGESTYPVMGAIKWQRQYHAMLAAPLGIVDVLLGHLAYVLLRVTLTSAAFLAVAFALGAIRSPEAVLALPVAALCGLAHSAPTFAFAARQENDAGFNVLFRFVVMPMFLFSGTFFPVDQLPALVQPVAWLTPLWHAVQLCRDLSTGTATLAAGAGHVGYLLVWVVLGTLAAAAALRRRLVV